MGLGKGQDTVAQPPRRIGVPVGPQGFRPSWQGDQQRRLRGVQRAGGLAEIGVGRCFNPNQVAAERRQGQPQPHDLTRRQPASQIDGSCCFQHLRGQRPRPWVEQTDDLHRQCRATGDHMAGPHHLPRGPQQRTRIEAGFRGEMPVFHRDQQGAQEGRDGVGRRLEPPHAARGRRKGQQGAVARDNPGTPQLRTGQAGRRQRAQSQHASDHRCHARGAQSGPAPPGFHGVAGSTVICTVSCRANTAGRYMSATVMPGYSKLPGVTARRITARRKDGWSGVKLTTAA